MGGRRAGGAATPAPVPPDGVRAGVRGRACARRRRSGAARRAPATGAWGCVIAALFVFAAVLLTVPAVVRAWRRARRDAGGDAPAKLLALAVTGLPESHRDWGRAMCAELETVRGARSAVALQPRLRARGGRDPGARDADLARARRRRPARRDRRRRSWRPWRSPATASCATRGCARTATLRSSRSRSPALLVAYGAVTLALSRGAGVREVTARRHGLVGGVVIGAAWLVVLSPTGVLKEWVLVPLIVALLGPGCVAALAARAGGVVTAGSAPRYGAGSWAACWSSPSG